jgi:hypothetical protein
VGSKDSFISLLFGVEVMMGLSVGWGLGGMRDGIDDPFFSWSGRVDDEFIGG